MNPAYKSGDVSLILRLLSLSLAEKLAAGTRSKLGVMDQISYRHSGTIRVLLGYLDHRGIWTRAFSGVIAKIHTGLNKLIHYEI